MVKNTARQMGASHGQRQDQWLPQAQPSGALAAMCWDRSLKMLLIETYSTGRSCMSGNTCKQTSHVLQLELDTLRLFSLGTISGEPLR